MQEQKQVPIGKGSVNLKESTRVPHRDLIDQTKQVFKSHLTSHYQTGKQLLAGPVLTSLTAWLGTLARPQEFYDLVREHVPAVDRDRILRSVEDAYHYGLFLFHVLKPDFADVEAQMCLNLKAKLRTIDEPISDNRLRGLCELVWQCADDKRWSEIEAAFYDVTRKQELDYLELDLIHDRMSLPKKPTSDLRARTHMLLGVLRAWPDNEIELHGDFGHGAAREWLQLNKEFYRLIENKLKRGVGIEGDSV